MRDKIGIVYKIDVCRVDPNMQSFKKQLEVHYDEDRFNNKHGSDYTRSSTSI